MLVFSDDYLWSSAPGSAIHRHKRPRGTAGGFVKAACVRCGRSVPVKGHGLVLLSHLEAAMVSLIAVVGKIPKPYRKSVAQRVIWKRMSLPEVIWPDIGKVYQIHLY